MPSETDEYVARTERSINETLRDTSWLAAIGAMLQLEQFTHRVSLMCRAGMAVDDTVPLTAHTKLVLTALDVVSVYERNRDAVALASGELCDFLRMYTGTKRALALLTSIRPEPDRATYDELGYVLPRYRRLQELVRENKLHLVQVGPDEEKTIGLLCCDGSAHHPKRNHITNMACRGHHHTNYWKMHDHLRDERIIR